MRQRERPLHLVAHPHAPPAGDAQVAVELDVGVRVVSAQAAGRAGEVRRAPRRAAAHGRARCSSGRRSERVPGAARPSARAPAAPWRRVAVVGAYDLHLRSAGVVQAVTGAAPVADQAGPAGARRSQPVVGAQRGNVRTGRPGGRPARRALGHLHDRTAVDASAPSVTRRSADTRRSCARQPDAAPERRTGCATHRVQQPSCVALAAAAGSALSERGCPRGRACRCRSSRRAPKSQSARSRSRGSTWSSIATRLPCPSAAPAATREVPSSGRSSWSGPRKPPERAAHLERPEPGADDESAAQFERRSRAQRRTQLDLVRAGSPEALVQADQQRARSPVAAAGGVGAPAVGDDGRHRGQRLHVVQRGGTAEQAVLGGVRRTRTHRGPQPRHRPQQRRLLPGQIGPGAGDDLDVQPDTGAVQVLAQVTGGVRPRDRVREPVECAWVLRAHVDEPSFRTAGQRGEGQPLQHPVRVLLHQHPVGEGPGSPSSPLATT